MTELLPSLQETVYVGVSAGSIAVTPVNCDAEFNLQFVPEGSDMGDDAERADLGAVHGASGATGGADNATHRSTGSGSLQLRRPGCAPGGISR